MPFPTCSGRIIRWGGRRLRVYLYIDLCSCNHDLHSAETTSLMTFLFLFFRDIALPSSACFDASQQCCAGLGQPSLYLPFYAHAHLFLFLLLLLCLRLFFFGVFPDEIPSATPTSPCDRHLLSVGMPRRAHVRFVRRGQRSGIRRGRERPFLGKLRGLVPITCTTATGMRVCLRGCRGGGRGRGGRCGGVLGFYILLQRLATSSGGARRRWRDRR